jgi:ADP-heptose:LPS heptosyltransferase
LTALSPEGSPKFLLVRLSSFGDIVLAEPVARVLKERFPGCRLIFATREDYRALPALYTSVDEVVGVGPGDARRERGYGGRAYDLAVDLQGNQRSARLIRRLGIGRVLRYRRPRLGRFFTVYLPWIWRGQQPPTLETYFRTLRPIGIRYGGETPHISPAPSDIEKAAIEVGKGPCVGVCPGSSSPHKSWGDQRFADLAGILARDFKVLVVGSEHDAAAVRIVRDRTAGLNVAAYVGREIGRIAAWLALCRVTVTNDSGLMHLAGAVGSRPVAIFGPTSPLLGFAPAAEGSVVLSLGLKCSPCSYHGNRPCRLDRRYCMEGIAPERVASVVAGMMEAEA